MTRATGAALKIDTILVQLYLITHVINRHKKQLPTNKDGYKGSETTIRKVVTRRIHWLWVFFCRSII